LKYGISSWRAGEVLTEEKNDPDAASAEFIYLWMVDGAGMARQEGGEGVAR
jgi:hypothetical protein